MWKNVRRISKFLSFYRIQSGIDNIWNPRLLFPSLENLMVQNYRLPHWVLILSTPDGGVFKISIDFNGKTSFIFYLVIYLFFISFQYME